MGWLVKILNFKFHHSKNLGFSWICLRNFTQWPRFRLSDLCWQTWKLRRISNRQALRILKFLKMAGNSTWITIPFFRKRIYWDLNCSKSKDPRKLTQSFPLNYLYLISFRQLLVSKRKKKRLGKHDYNLNRNLERLKTEREVLEGDLKMALEDIEKLTVQRDILMKSAMKNVIFISRDS